MIKPRHIMTENFKTGKMLKPRKWTKLLKSYEWYCLLYSNEDVEEIINYVSKMDVNYSKPVTDLKDGEVMLLEYSAYPKEGLFFRNPTPKKLDDLLKQIFRSEIPLGWLFEILVLDSSPEKTLLNAYEESLVSATPGFTRLFHFTSHSKYLAEEALRRITNRPEITGGGEFEINKESRNEDVIYTVTRKGFYPEVSQKNYSEEIFINTMTQEVNYTDILNLTSGDVNPDRNGVMGPKHEFSIFVKTDLILPDGLLPVGKAYYGHGIYENPSIYGEPGKDFVGGAEYHSPLPDSVHSVSKIPSVIRNGPSLRTEEWGWVEDLKDAGLPLGEQLLNTATRLRHLIFQIAAESKGSGVKTVEQLLEEISRFVNGSLIEGKSKAQAVAKKLSKQTGKKVVIEKVQMPSYWVRENSAGTLPTVVGNVPKSVVKHICKKKGLRCEYSKEQKSLYALKFKNDTYVDLSDYTSADLADNITRIIDLAP